MLLYLDWICVGVCLWGQLRKRFIFSNVSSGYSKRNVPRGNIFTTASCVSRWRNTLKLYQLVRGIIRRKYFPKLSGWTLLTIYKTKKNIRINKDGFEWESAISKNFVSTTNCTLSFFSERKTYVYVVIFIMVHLGIPTSNLLSLNRGVLWM